MSKYIVLIKPNFAKIALKFVKILTKNCEKLIKNGKFTIKFKNTHKIKIENIIENKGKTNKLLNTEIGANSPKYLKVNGIVPIVALMVTAIDSARKLGNLILLKSLVIGFAKNNIPSTEPNESKNPTSNK